MTKCKNNFSLLALQ